MSSFITLELDFLLIGTEEQNPVEAMTAVEPDDLVVERPALIETLGEDVRLDPLDGHIHVLPAGDRAPLRFGDRE